MSPVPRHIALTIAGFDPSSGAGITADLKTFAAHHVYGVACITAMTVQSTLGVRAVEPQSGDLVRQTLTCLAEDLSFSGVKIGMLGSSEVAGAVCSFLATGPVRSRIVLDPVVRSSSGAPLIDPAGIRLIRSRLLAQVGWVTPNLDELAILVGEAPIPAGDADRVVGAARRLKDFCAGEGNDELNIVVTGGHSHRPDDFLLSASGEEFWLPGQRIVTEATHGTGCAFSSALLCGLLAGLDAEPATAMAKRYVAEALRSAYPVGKGKGPMNHLFSFEPNGE
jgi:hydroxymethylpyrimidine/phosphomethylpyrimidine kinase